MVLITPLQKSNNSKISILQELSIILIPFMVWVYLFRGHLSGYYSLESDAQVYFEHFKFYTDHLLRGVYPLWDPYRDGGVPNEFFLRRIGSYNPAILFILILRFLGVSFVNAYGAFLGMYFLCGMLGFYLLVKIIFRNTLLAFTGYLLLMFSSLGFRLFDSFVLLIFVPTVWHFYFLIYFFQRPNPFAMLGITFTFMLVFTTYIPFYFLTVWLWFLICFVLFFPLKFRLSIFQLINFIKSHVVFTFICASFLLVSIIPGYCLYQEGKSGNMILSKRQEVQAREVQLNEGAALGMELKNTFQVPLSKIEQGGIAPLLFVDQWISNFKDMSQGSFYFPLWGTLLLALGLFTKISKRLLFMMVLGGGLFLISVTDATPLYKFLYSHIFFFKLFRNWQFFIWLALLPIFILITLEIMQKVIYLNVKNWSMFSYVLIEHAVVFLYFHISGDLTGFHAGSLLVSLLIFSFYFWPSFKGFNLIRVYLFNSSHWLSYILIFIIIVLPSSHVFFNSIAQSVIYTSHAYRMDRSYFTFSLPKHETIPIEQITQLNDIQKRDLLQNDPPNPYVVFYASKFNRLLSQKVPDAILNYFRSSNLILYDRVVPIDENRIDWGKIRHEFAYLENTAFVPSNYSDPKKYIQLGLSQKAIPVTQETLGFQLINSDIQNLKFSTSFIQNKFLTYNINYHLGWRAFIDKKPVKVWRSNIVFLGVWIPEGRHSVEFRFLSPLVYGYHWGLVCLFCIIFIWLIFLGVENFFKTIAID